MIVVDASALIEVLLRTPGGCAIEARLFRESEELHAPHLIDTEVASVLRRLASRGDLDDRRGREILADLADLPVHRYPHGWLLGTAWRLRAHVTAYDAMYVALADALGAPLLTRDARLAKAVGRWSRSNWFDGRFDFPSPASREKVAREARRMRRRA